jgi:hypothetical protein
MADLQEQLFYAVLNGDLELISQLVQNGADVNCKFTFLNKCLNSTHYFDKQNCIHVQHSSYLFLVLKKTIKKRVRGEHDDIRYVPNLTYVKPDDDTSEYLSMAQCMPQHLDYRMCLNERAIAEKKFKTIKHLIRFGANVNKQNLDSIEYFSSFFEFIVLQIDECETTREIGFLWSVVKYILDTNVYIEPFIGSSVLNILTSNTRTRKLYEVHKFIIKTLLLRGFDVDRSQTNVEFVSQWTTYMLLYCFQYKRLFCFL